ncbi:MAG: uroporphyrinogen-III synthase, partial [Thermodesulfobacteriota bacterium]
SSLKVCAIGPATAKELNKREIQIDYIPKEFIAEAILDGFKEMQVKGKKILLARAEKARDILPNGLKEMGAEVEVVEVYRAIKPKGGAKRLKLLLKEKIDAIAFTSSSTVDHFVDLLKGVDHKKALKGVAIACIGPITADTARKRGMKVHIQPKEYTIPGLTQAIAKYFTKITNRQSPKK